jgi:putative ABC transport system substrate-binding protein
MTGDVQSLAHPGGNITGLSQMHPEMAAKQLDLLKQIAPGISRVAVLWNATVPTKLEDWKQLKPVARSLGVELLSFEVRGPADFDSAFTAIRQEHPDALLELGDPLTVAMRKPIVDFELKEGLPEMYTHRQFVEIGGLASYGADQTYMFNLAARIVDKILKGAKPADIPVEQPTKFEMLVNLKTATALGLTIPQSILAGADEVIE